MTEELVTTHTSLLGRPLHCGLALATYTLGDRSDLCNDVPPCMRKSGGVLRLDVIDDVVEVAGDGWVDDEERAEYMLEEPDAALDPVVEPPYPLLKGCRVPEAFAGGYRDEWGCEECAWSE